MPNGISYIPGRTRLVGAAGAGGLNINRRDPDSPLAVRQRPDPCADDCTPRCPACGGLKCLCRPRFFCGQLLTDEDLTALQQYVIDKNRLHNRYLVGWGVACGLEVACDPCDPRGVVVRAGYALSPCGDDIVVCHDAAVDICALIDTCNDREPPCDGPFERPPRDCRGGRNRWVLAICYDERPTRGVTAQVGAGDDACDHKCSCGGSGSGGCGCGGHGSSGGGGCGCGSKGKNGSASTTVKKKKPHAQPCEPTRVCETYRFVVYPAPEPDLGLKVPVGIERDPDKFFLWLYTNRARFGPLLERVLCCAIRALQLRSAIREGKALDRAFAESTYIDYVTAVQEFAADFAVHHCAFVTRTTELRTEADVWRQQLKGQPFDANMKQLLNQRIGRVDDLWLELVAECLCSALLPACPPPAPNNCVPLAVVRLRTGECRVEDICNWEARKLLITWPNITYWLSWLPWGNLRKWVAGICCGPERSQWSYYLMMLMIGMTMNSLQTAAGAIVPKKKAKGAGNVNKAMKADNLFSHMTEDFMRVRTERGDDPGWAGLAAKLATFSADAITEVAAPPEVADLARRLDAAEVLIRDQDRQLRLLRNKVK